MYPTIRFHQLSALPDGELIALIGHYLRNANGAYLQLADHRLPLLGDPFSWIPRQNTLVEIWGEFIKGQKPRLIVHDARPVAAERPALIITTPLITATSIVVAARVMNIGDQQVALTPDRKSVLLVGEELDERIYMISGNLLTLNPPTLEVDNALPLTMPNPSEPSGCSADSMA